MNYRVVFYRNARGAKPAGEFLKSLSGEARQKCVAYLRLLATEGSNLPRNIAAHVEGDLWELRPERGGTEYRFFYFTLVGNTIYVVHAITKRTRRLSRDDVATAQARVAEIRARHERGEL